VSGLHDAWPGARDDHEAGLRDLVREFHRFEIFLPRGQGAGRAEDGDFACLMVGREKAEGVAQFGQRGADDPHVATVLHVCQQFERIDNYFFDQIRVITAAPRRNQFLNAGFDHRVNLSFFHADYTIGLRRKSNTVKRAWIFFGGPFSARTSTPGVYGQKGVTTVTSLILRCLGCYIARYRDVTFCPFFFARAVLMVFRICLQNTPSNAEMETEFFVCVHLRGLLKAGAAI